MDGCGICDISSLRNSNMVKRAVNFILSLQKEDGGWADDNLVTRLSMGALAAAGGLKIEDEALKRGVLWLVDHQNSDGSWGRTWDTVAVLDRFRKLGVEWKH